MTARYWPGARVEIKATGEVGTVQEVDWARWTPRSREGYWLYLVRLDDGRLVRVYGTSKIRLAERRRINA